MLTLSTPAAAADNEFYQPSWTQLPSPSAYNTTPSCPPTSSNFFQCDAPASALPPQDPNNTASYLNSGYWPSEKRPDIEMYAANWLPFSPTESCLQHLPHYCYLVDAERAGYPVTHAPEVGDLGLRPAHASEGAALAELRRVATVRRIKTGTWAMSNRSSLTARSSRAGGEPLPCWILAWGSRGSLALWTPSPDFVPLMPTGTPLPVPANATPPTIVGSDEVGDDLYVRYAGSWRNDPPTAPVKRQYFWLRCNSSGASCSAIPGTMSESDVYPVIAADTGHTLRVAETTGNVAGPGSPALSAPTAVITKTRPQKLARAIRACDRLRRKRKRDACIAAARKRYSPKKLSMVRKHP